MSTDIIVAKVDRARALLLEARDAKGAKHVADLARAAEVYARRARLGDDAIRYATELKLDAERLLGEFMARAEKAKGGAEPGVGRRGKKNAGPVGSRIPPPTYGSLGIGKKQAARARGLAAMPAPLFEKVKADELTVSRAFREQRREERKATPAPALPEGVFDLLYADPPWEYDFAETESRAVENQYETMSVDAICAVSVPAADDAVLLLWATAPKLLEALRVMAAWGFTYRTHAVWNKERVGMGYWFRGQHELLLLGVRGAFHTPDPDVRPGSVFCFPRGKHSEKPEGIRAVVEAMFPKARRLELFARRVAPGWSSWGKEAG